MEVLCLWKSIQDCIVYDVPPALPEIATAPFDSVTIVMFGPAFRNGLPFAKVCNEPESFPVTTSALEAVTGPLKEAVLIEVIVPEIVVAPTKREVLNAVKGPFADPDANIETSPRKFVVPNTLKLE